MYTNVLYVLQCSTRRLTVRSEMITGQLNSVH